MKKQVYKDCGTEMNPHLTLGKNNECLNCGRNISKPLKPKKSIKKKETKLQEQIKQLEDRLGKLEKHFCTPAIHNHYPANQPAQSPMFQKCPRCGGSIIGGVGSHYC